MTVDYATARFTATPGEDYVEASRVLTRTIAGASLSATYPCRPGRPKWKSKLYSSSLTADTR